MLTLVTIDGKLFDEFFEVILLLYVLTVLTLHLMRVIISKQAFRVVNLDV